MLDALVTVSPLAGVLRPGRHGHAAGEAGLRLTEETIGGAASLAARAAGIAALAAALGWDLPTRPRRVLIQGNSVLWAGPGRWLVLSDRPIEAALRHRAGPAGSVADQSDSRVLLRLHGPCVRDVLAKGVAIDLHPRAFAVDDVAVTVAAHVGVLLWRDEADSFRIAVARSFAGSLAEWLVHSALEFGLQVD